MKRNLLILSGCLVVAFIAAAAIWYWTGHRESPVTEPEEEPEPSELVITNDHATNTVFVFEDEIPPADPLLVGKWQNADNPQWFKVYYDDFDEDEELYWGKEWDESEDVQEEDLRYHGNGWFRWEKRDNVLHEYATMDIRDVPIHKEYIVTLSDEDSLVYADPEFKMNIYRFGKATD